MGGGYPKRALHFRSQADLLIPFLLALAYAQPSGTFAMAPGGPVTRVCAPDSLSPPGHVFLVMQN